MAESVAVAEPAADTVAEEEREAVSEPDCERLDVMLALVDAVADIEPVKDSETLGVGLTEGVGDGEAVALDDDVAELDAVIEVVTEALALPLGETGDGEVLFDGEVLAPKETLAVGEGADDEEIEGDVVELPPVEAEKLRDAVADRDAVIDTVAEAAIEALDEREAVSDADSVTELLGLVLAPKLTLGVGEGCEEAEREALLVALAAPLGLPLLETLLEKEALAESDCEIEELPVTTAEMEPDRLVLANTLRLEVDVALIEAVCEPLGVGEALEEEVAESEAVALGVTVGEAVTLDDDVAELDAVVEAETEALPLPLGETGDGEVLFDGEVLAPKETLAVGEGADEEETEDDVVILPPTEAEPEKVGVTEAIAEPDTDADAAEEALGVTVAARDTLVEADGLRLVLAPKLTDMEGDGSDEADCEALLEKLGAALDVREEVAARDAETDAVAADEALVLRLIERDKVTLALASVLADRVRLALAVPLML